MHIGVGIFEGKELKDPVGTTLSTRSLTIKEEIFSVIGTRVLDANVLDINDANGLYGIEALSRGAKMASFINLEDHERELVAENLRTVGLDPEKYIIKEQPMNFFNAVEAEHKFDLIFFETRGKECFEMLGVILSKQQDSGVTAVIYPFSNEYSLDQAPHGFKIVETRDFEDKRLAIILKEK